MRIAATAFDPGALTLLLALAASSALPGTWSWLLFDGLVALAAIRAAAAGSREPHGNWPPRRSLHLG